MTPGESSSEEEERTTWTSYFSWRRTSDADSPWQSPPPTMSDQKKG